MKLRVAVYNMKWMSRLFDKNGTPKTTGTQGVRSARLAEIVKAMKPDVLGIVEGPDTLVSGARTASGQVQKWADHHGLHEKYKALHGFVSRGSQELCVLYRSDKIKVGFKPEKKASKNPFDQQFIVDTSDTLIQEVYSHYRPPLEILVRNKSAQPKEVARIIVAHTKSKGIFESVAMSRFQQLSERNRKKLYAECMSIRERCDQWLDDSPKRNVIVMGDINDGAGMDYFERQYARSAVEILMGDPWEPDLQLRHVLPRPKVGSKGWVPYTSNFTDLLTEYKVNVLIDHMMVSRAVQIEKATVWNPHLKENKSNAEVQALATELDKASDHYPVLATLDLTL